MSEDPDVLCMGKDDSSLVEQPIDTELDARFDDPAEGAVVVIGRVRDKERMVWSEMSK
jgi:hypothetical protein